MIYSLLTQHLENELLDRKQPLTEFQLNQVQLNVYADSVKFEYSLHSQDMQPNLIVQKYDFEYEFNFESNQIESLACILTQTNGISTSVRIDLLASEHPVPTMLVQKLVIKKSAPSLLWQPHNIYCIISQNSKYQKPETILGDLEIVERAEVVSYREPQEKKEKKKKTEHKGEQTQQRKESRPKTKLFDIDQIQLVKVAEEQPKQQQQPKKESIIPKQLFKNQQKDEEQVQNQKISNLAKKLDIPEHWKQSAFEFSEQQKKKWDIKYYEKLVLLRDCISKKYFYSHLLKGQMEEEYQKKFIKYALPPDFTDSGIIKKRKVYSKDVVCALIE